MNIKNRTKRFIGKVAKRYVRRYCPDVPVEDQDRREFMPVFLEAAKATGKPAGKVKLQERMFTLYHAAQAAPDGPTAECGVHVGLSTYIACKARDMKYGYRPWMKHYAIDSWEGLSAPTADDAGSVGGQGYIAIPVTVAMKNLVWFSYIEYIKGWVPEILNDLLDTPEFPYAYVHLDMDLGEPMAEALAYFYPRMMDKGIIICDDYGNNRWPGVKKALDRKCQEMGIQLIALSTCQAIIVK